MANTLNKVPQITLFFWIIKVLSTTVGETLADFLNTKLGLGLINTSYVLGALFLTALLVQLTRNRYIPAVYWTVVVLVSVVGTLVSDTLVDKLGFGLQTTTIAFSCALAVVFVLWYASERTLSVHWIATTRRGLFYWAAILFTAMLDVLDAYMPLIRMASESQASQTVVRPLRNYRKRPNQSNQRW